MLSFVWKNGAYEPINQYLHDKCLEDNKDKDIIPHLFIKYPKMLHTFLSAAGVEEEHDKHIYIYRNDRFIFRLHYSLGTGEYFGWLEEIIID